MARAIQYGKSFLLWCAHDLMNFKIQELNAITSLFKIKFDWLEEPCKSDPFFLITVKSRNDIQRIMSRTVLIRSAYELWAHSSCHTDLYQKLKSLPREFTDPFAQSSSTFKVQVDSFGKKISSKIKLQRIEELAFMSFAGDVKLNDPDNTFFMMEYYGTDRNNVPEEPYRVFFGRWICDGQRHVSYKISLKTRKFIGNTSMDPLLSLVMANLAQIEPGQLVLDPFVGSGSILVAAAHFGAYVLGTDIDYLMLHGKAKPSRCNQKKREPDENVKANFKQYGLETKYLDVLVSDASLPLWRTPSIFDSIITDPPYGIREPTEKIGTEKDYKIPEHLAANHIPSKVAYTLQDIIEDLLEFAAVYLKLNGRLVFWMPLHRDDFDKNSLPSHPCLSLVSYCEQLLTNHSSRFLITMEKTSSDVDSQNKATVPKDASAFRSKYFQAHREKLLQKQSVYNHKNENKS